jgi:hypothetical protein
MSELVDASTWQYAVVAIRTHPCREQPVLAYPDKTLRAVIAAPSIIAVGYDSRNQAVTDIDRCIPMTVASQRRSTAELVGTNRKSLEEARAAKRRSADGMVLRGPGAFLVTFCSTASLRRLCSFTRGTSCPRLFGSLSRFRAAQSHPILGHASARYNRAVPGFEDLFNFNVYALCGIDA